MSKLPQTIKDTLKLEAAEWDNQMRDSSEEENCSVMEYAEPFMTQRSPRLPVSVRLDPSDIAMLKRFARKRGIPYSQLIALWLHERIEQEKEGVRS